MTDALAAVHRLEQAADVLAAAADDELRTVGQALGNYLNGTQPDLERALELAAAPGELSWRTRRDLRRRDGLICALGASFGGSINSQAAQLARLMSHYSTTPWTRDRAAGVPLSPDARRQLLFSIFTLDPSPPLSIRGLDKILRAAVCTGITLSSAGALA